jgi:ribosome maturation factor RimP
MPKLSSVLQEVIAPVVETLGYDFWGGYYTGQGSHALLRIYIDKPEGITVNDCQRVSRQLSAVLDVEDVISHEYVLEVSSPGLDRPLFTLQQFERFVGSEVRVKVYTPINQQRRFVAKIMKVCGDSIILKIDNNDIEIAFSEIEKAHLII